MWAETLGYRESRLPYLKKFFAEVAKAAALTGAEALLDLGCGPGEVALEMAPYGASMTALDAEQPMLDELDRRAKAAGRHIKLVCAKVDEAPLDLGPFRLITIGMAHWFMHSSGTLERLERWLLPGGRVAICTHGNHLTNDWFVMFEKIRRKWARADLHRPKITKEEFFAGTSFELNRVIEVEAQRSLALKDLLRRAQGYSTSTPAALGETRTRQMLTEISSAMAPFFRDGPVTERFFNQAHLFRRRGDP
jgi:cyclopropane fatty-acyl-phospholipid synthase-like methyltransferase